MSIKHILSVKNVKRHERSEVIEKEKFQKSLSSQEQKSSI